MKMLKKFVFLLLFPFVTYGQNTSAIESIYIENINEEIVKAKLKYDENSQSSLFEDIQDVLISLKIESSFSKEKKIKCYNILYKYVKDINANLYSERKIYNGSYSQSIRVLPTVFYHLNQPQWEEYLLLNYKKTIPMLNYIYSDYSHSKIIKRLALEHPSTFYQSIDDLMGIYNFKEIFNQIYAESPHFWVEKIEKKDFLKELLNSNIANKSIAFLKKNFGQNSYLYGLLDESINNNFNDTYEPNFDENRLELSKLLLNNILKQGGIGRGSALSTMRSKSKWILDEYRKSQYSVLKLFNINQLFVLMAINSDKLSSYDFMVWTNFMRTEFDQTINSETIDLIPRKNWYTLMRNNEEANNIENFALLFDVETASSIVSYNNNANKKALLSQKNKHWFSKKYQTPQAPKTAKKPPQNTKKTTTKVPSFSISRSKIALLNWTRNLNKINSNINNILNSAIGPKFSDFLCQYQPKILLNNRKHIQGRADFQKLVDKSTYYAPNAIKTYLSSSTDPISIAVNKSKNPTTQLVKKIFDRYNFNTKAYTLLDKIYNKELSLERAHQIGETELQYMKELMDITIRKNPRGLHSTEEAQNQLTLKYIRNINDHPSEGHQHLRAISGFNSKQLYTLMVLGKEEIFQFAFNHFYSYFLNRLGTKSFIEFLPSVNDYRYREFCVLLANFEKFGDLIYTNASDQQVNQFIGKMVDIDLSKITAIEEAANVCEFIYNCDDSRVQRHLQKHIYHNYQEALKKNDQMAMAVYSLLGSNIGHHAIVHNDWFTKMENDLSQFTLSYINVEDMKNKNQNIIEVCYFYNDDDGIVSFKNFIATFRKLPYWMLQDLGSYYYISSVYGNPIEIFANKPQQEKTGQATIKEYLTINELEPSIVIHRGHSYHSQKTIDQMVGSPKFIFMGSCGGYYKIPELLLRSPDAQILSTKQVGTMSINDPMIASINELLRKGENIDWPEYWGSQKGKFYGNKHYKMYIPPHKNNAALYINAFFKLVNNKNL